MWVMGWAVADLSSADESAATVDSDFLRLRFEPVFGAIEVSTKFSLPGM